jgi:hypothetical protein
VGAERADVRYANRATVDHGCDTRTHADQVGLDALDAEASGRGAVGDVGVEVDQAGDDVAIGAAHLDHPSRVRRG